MRLQHLVLIGGLFFSAGSIMAAVPANLKAAYARPKDIPHPADNKYTKEKEILGKALFFDPRLSGSNMISCGSCHNPSLSWGDGLERAVGHGHQQLGRRTPTVLNLAWAPKLFWDGRAASLEEQALGPIKSEGEMNMKIDNLPEKLSNIKGYKELFAKAFPGETISLDLVAKALATYQRGVVSGQAPFDRWLAGNEKAVSESVKKGFDLFNNKAKCAQCHAGWAFTDHGFYDIGVPGDDIGRGKHLKLASMQHAFKTPTLRNVAHRAPYLHDGSEKTLMDVVEFYNQGGKAKRPSINMNVTQLGLTENEKKDLVSFLESLTSEDKPVTLPILPN